MCGNYSREETIQGRKLYEEIRYTINCVCHSIRSMFRVLGKYNFEKLFLLERKQVTLGKTLPVLVLVYSFIRYLRVNIEVVRD